MGQRSWRSGGYRLPMTPSAYGEQHDEYVETAIEKAMELVDDTYEQPGYRGQRKWLSASPPDSYDSADYRVEIHVLEGSPPKGMVLVDRSAGVVLAFGASGAGLKELKRFSVSL